MSIEFQCNRCGSTLRVPDEIAGRKAQCPECQEIQTVPLASPVPPGNLPASAPQHSPYQQWNAPPSPNASSDPYAAPQNSEFPPNASLPTYQSGEFRDSGNPFQSPMGASDSFGFAQPTAPGEPVHTKVSFSWLFQTVWDVFFTRFTDFLVLGLISSVISIITWAPYYVIVIVGEHAAENFDGSEVLFFALLVCTYLLGLVANWVVMAGGERFALSIARGEQAKYSLIFQKPGQTLMCVLSMFLLTVVMAIFAGGYVGICYLLGQLFADNFNDPDMAFLVVLGVTCIPAYAIFIAIFVRFSCSWCFILDRDEGPIQSLGSSWRYASGNAMALFGVIFVYSILSTLFGCLTCYLGFILVMPMMCCLCAVAYLGVTGQPIINPKRQFAPSSGQDFNIGSSNW